MELRQELIRALERMGYDRHFGEALANELRTERAMRRMLGYLRQANPKRIEDIADELVAICDERDRWVEKKAAEWFNSKYNAYLNSRPTSNDDP